MGDPPLAGLKVVEISMYAQGPIAGMILAGLGADVVKIEPVGSQDPFRTFAGMFGVQLDEEGARQIFASVNRGKRCIALDVTSDAGRPVFHRLVEDADVFVSNLRRSALDKMGADADTLTGLNPRLVYARGAGFGSPTIHVRTRWEWRTPASWTWCRPLRNPTIPPAPCRMWRRAPTSRRRSWPASSSGASPARGPWWAPPRSRR